MAMIHSYPLPKEVGKTKSKEKIQSRALSKLSVFILSLTGIILVVCAGWYMKIQAEIYVTHSSISSLELETANLQAQTEEIMNQNSNQYNYQSVKEAASKQGLSIDKERVRSFE